MVSMPRRNQAGNLGVAEFFQQPKDVPIGRPLPEIIPIVEVAAHTDRVDTGIQSTRVQGQQAPFAPSQDADLRVLVPGVLSAGLFGKPVDASQHLLNLVTDQSPSQLKGCPISPFPIRQQVEFVLAIDQKRYNHAATALGQPPGKLRFRRHSGHQSDKLLGRLIAIPNGHHVRQRLAARWQQQQPFAVDVSKGGPTHGEHFVIRSLGHERRANRRAVESQPVERYSRVSHSQDMSQPLTIRLDRFVVSLLRGKIAMPVLASAGERLFGLIEQETINSVDQLRGDVSFQP